MKYFTVLIGSFFLSVGFVVIYGISPLQKNIAYQTDLMSSHSYAITANSSAIKTLQAELASQGSRERAVPDLLKVVVPVADKQKDGIGMGSAVAIGPHALITAYHVVDGATQIRVGDTMQPAKVGWHDKIDDIAILHTRITLHPVRVFEGNLKPGQRIVVVGDPMGLGMIIKDGRFQTGQDNQHGFSSAGAWPGMSGGGVFCWSDGEWKLAGITQEIPAMNSGQAVPLDVFYLMSALR